MGGLFSATKSLVRPNETPNLQLFLKVKLEEQFMIKIKGPNVNIGLSLWFAVGSWWCH